MEKTKIQLRALYDLDEMAGVVDVQRAIWGDDLSLLVHPHMLFSIAANGGQVLGAFAGEQMVGCAISFLGTDSDDSDRPAMANLKLYSKRVAVLPEYRNQGIAYGLKTAQYAFAAQRGIRLMTWTFDPLLSVNAYFNVRKLGAVVSRFMPDFYGTDAGELSLSGSSDRLQADWWLSSPRVKERLTGNRRPLALAQYLDGGTRILNPAKLSAKMLPMPSEAFIKPPTTLGLIEIPPDFRRIVDKDDELAHAWREHIRAVIADTIQSGYIITDFVYEPFEGRQRSFYVVSHQASLPRFSQN